jgi:hypothetical protein
MSERYGTPGELKEALAALEQHCDEAIEMLEIRLRSAEVGGDPRYDAGGLTAYRDVLDFIIVNPGG